MSVGCPTRDGSTPCTARTSRPHAAPAGRRMGDSRGRRPHRLLQSSYRGPRKPQEDLVERSEARRQSIQRQAQIGDRIAQLVELLVTGDGELDEAVVRGRREAYGDEVCDQSLPTLADVDGHQPCPLEQ